MIFGHAPEFYTDTVLLYLIFRRPSSHKGGLTRIFCRFSQKCALRANPRSSKARFRPPRGLYPLLHGAPLRNSVLSRTCVFGKYLPRAQIFNGRLAESFSHGLCLLSVLPGFFSRGREDFFLGENVHGAFDALFHHRTGHFIRFVYIAVEVIIVGVAAARTDEFCETVPAFPFPL